ncbi:MATE family efflux transporter [Sorangium sp. So ce1036]|uniref:MATE family efflux transporter n=1 Tax=Sorangium sp. So ce1036 TaxID=3133328 RepID=UPI003F0D16F1
MPQRRAQPGQEALSFGSYARLALPLTLAGLSGPLMNATDTAVMGHFGDAATMGGVAVGSQIFNTLYWLLGFFRTSTSGFAAQARGAGDRQDAALQLFRPLLFAALVGCAFVLVRAPLEAVALDLMGAHGDVESHAATYYEARIWGAPAVLMGYVVAGWLIGMGEVRWTMLLYVGMDLLNLALTVAFVTALDLGVRGVAWATVLAEATKILVGLLVIWRKGHLRGVRVRWRRFADLHAVTRMWRVNGDVLLRTTCLLGVFGWITRQSALLGPEVLAVNAILMHVQLIISCALGGLGNTAGMLAGQAIGAQSRERFHDTLRLSFWTASLSAVALSLACLVAQPAIIGLFTPLASIAQMTGHYFIWMALFPVAIFWSMILECVFTGATRAGPVRNSLLAATLVFFAAWPVLSTRWGNHGLWMAFLLFSLTRTVYLHLALPRLLPLAFPARPREPVTA